MRFYNEANDNHSGSRETRAILCRRYVPVAPHALVTNFALQYQSTPIYIKHECSNYRS
jgi:hypothetical protein